MASSIPGPLTPNIPFTPAAKAFLAEVVKDAGVGADLKTPLSMDDFLPYKSTIGTLWAQTCVNPPAPGVVGAPTDTVFVPVDMEATSQPISVDTAEQAYEAGKVYVAHYTDGPVEQYYKIGDGGADPGFLGPGAGGPAR
jgi:hypothetical protein